MKFPNINLPSNKRFGYFFSVIFFIVAGYFLYIENQTIGYIFVIFSVLFIVTTLINADLLRPLNKLWMHFGFLLGKIISPIVLGIIFFGLFTPYGIVMRLLGRDELCLKTQKKKSHWILRSKSTTQINFKQQF